MTLGTMLYTFENVTSTNLAVIRYCLITSSTFFFIKYISNTQKRLNITSVLFFLWTLVIINFSLTEITRGDNNYILLKRVMSGEILLYVLPLIGFCEINLDIVRRIIQFAFYLAILGCFLVPMAPYIYQEVRAGDNSAFGYENLSRIFSASATIVILTFPYHNKKITITSVTSILVSLIIFLVTARRNMIIYYVSVLVFSFFTLYWTKTLSELKKFYLSLLISLLTIVTVILFLINLDLFSLVISRFESGFESRDFIIDEFVDDFNSSPLDWYTGRGIFGTFRTSILMTNDAAGTRDGIENGYLTHILRGGYIYLVLIILVSINAVIKGFFESKNTLTKACSSIIIIYLIDMVGFGIPENHIKYLIVWVSIAICNNKRIRQMDDQSLANLIGLN